MWLRIVRAQGLIGNEIVAIARRYEEEDLPSVMQQPGCLGAGLGVNMARGGALSLTFWESEQHMAGAKPVADAARSKLVDDFRNPDPYRIDELEVIFSSNVLAAEGSRVTPYMHLTRYEKLTDETATRMTDTCIQDARLDVDDRGSEGVVIGADLKAGTLAKIGFWESMRDMRAVQLQYAGAVPGVELPYTDNFEVSVARGLDALPSVEARSPA